MVVAATACARTVARVPITPAQPAVLAELWQAPAEPRDLFHGPGGAALMPGSSAFTFIAGDHTGFSPGFEVTDVGGRAWTVKTGPEAQTEVVTSRILWAIGFHQPATYYVSTWSLTGARTGPQPPGRFRPDLPSQEVIGDWPWHANPFVGMPEYGGLIVTNLLLTNWDWKQSNNKIYQLDTPVNGVSRWFLVRDVGASLGRFTYPSILRFFRLRGFGQGTRNDLPGFESQGFIKAIDGDSVTFHYSGLYRDVISTVKPMHVRWACERLAALTDAQWNDAFRAGGYSPEQTVRWITRIKEKIAQGLELTAPQGVPGVRTVAPSRNTSGNPATVDPSHTPPSPCRTWHPNCSDYQIGNPATARRGTHESNNTHDDEPARCGADRGHMCRVQ